MKRNGRQWKSCRCDEVYAQKEALIKGAGEGRSMNKRGITLLSAGAGDESFGRFLFIPLFHGVILLIDRFLRDETILLGKMIIALFHFCVSELTLNLCNCFDLAWC